MATPKDLTTREIKRTIGIQRIRGRVMSNPQRKNFDALGIAAPTWCVDVDIGADVLLRDVPVKIAGHQARAYARLGSPVFLERDAQGRYQVIAAADRTAAQGNLRLLNEDTGLMAAGGSAGFTYAAQPFTFYQGTMPESFYNPAVDANVLSWFRAYDRALGLPSKIYPNTDTNGAGVFRLDDKAAGGRFAVQYTAANQPLYRRFQTTGGNTNKRSTIDGDGTNDGMVCSSQITESVGGVISIFAVVNKEAAGAGDDVVLQTQRWRLQSRSAAADQWGFNNGGGVQNSGSALTTSMVLIELVATAFNNVNLFQNGVALGNFTGAGAGMANAASSFMADNGLTLAHNGTIAELLVLNETVSPAKRLTIEQYFNQSMFVPFAKWGNLSDAFPKILVLDAAGAEVPLP